MPGRKPEVVKILYRNREQLSEFIKDYESHNQEEDFEKLKAILVKKLGAMEAV